MSLSWASPGGDGVDGRARGGHAAEALLVRPLQGAGERRRRRRRRVARDRRRPGRRRRGRARPRDRRGRQRRARPPEPALQRGHARPSSPSAPREIADQHEALEVELLDREAIVGRGMGAFAAVAQGSHAEPRLIVLRYRPAGASGPHLGFVGKAVTFDTGGISIKPSAKMQEMKFDMSGGAAVIESMGAIAELGLPVDDHRRRAVDREHAERPRGEAGRHRHRDERQDDRDEQHRRRGPADPGRRALLRASSRAPSGSSTWPRSPARSSSRSATPTRACSRTTTTGAREVDGRRATPPARSAGGCRSTRSTSS